MNTYIGARYLPMFGRKGESSVEWDNTKPYEPLTIVTYQGNSYTSRQPVPAGIDISNTDYWAVSGNYNAQIEAYRSEVLQYAQEVESKAEQTDLDALGAKLPASQFTSTNTVKQYIDTAISNEANSRSQGDNNLGTQINTLSQKLPVSQFSGTVKEYIDSGLNGKATVTQFNDLSSKLPASAFGSTTVKQYIDTAVAQSRGVNSLRDRKIVCVGDSLTYSPSAHASTYWPEYLHTLYGATTYRFAHGGTGFVATTSSSTKTFSMDIEDAHASTDFNDADITDVIILGGLNDYSVADNQLNSAISDCLGKAMTYFTNARIHVGFNIKGVSPLGTIHENSVKQLPIMYYVANLRGATVIENPWTWANNGTYDAGDGIHVNANGQRNFAGRIASHLCGGSPLDVKYAELNFTSTFANLLTGSSNKVMAYSDGYTVNVYARGQFDQSVTMPTGNIPMFNLWEEFKSGIITNTNQLLSPLNCDTAMVVSDSYVALPRAYYNGGASVNVQFLHRMDLGHGSGLFGIHLSWPQGL